MKKWIFLTLAILVEVTATLSLKAALEAPALYAVVVAGYAAAFLCMFQALREGMSLGVGYGIWAACGVALTAVLSAVIFHEPLTLPMGIGIAAVMGGVLLVEIGSQQAQNTPDTAREQKEATAR
ncbi:QacE family quaternary ammonium compound efflux SMR transporter [Kocuria palustris]|jgi:small multidrug resistance pump|uniref:DMT family transporter n=1 Tax=Kocuria TaxID=57493 RepID=UPI0010F72901|nr:MULTISPECIES: SMR family transporter [Kocuria]MBN6753937.1 QacE family quaternary ammonium compound efflux SMR transporter [Kocuria palustris]MBN6758785.1 QacE family quaternary ammonium compound efflux SMR transporter [Kocuria palustris]MBN6764042.1 QacE family quaternary ammonium compound efflux SMR transporter [Kocuria palustris]MBN6783411.1 QacE family quaternary ammonium compound efflux SMR transporter [Kocuria palustris]MBN6800009.1 QacE family quaternary ammonium compound efflux SMR 